MKQRLSHNQGQISEEIGLPREPDSAAELLSATHLFVVDIISLQATDWAFEEDGLEHRRLQMQLRLEQLFKGTIALDPGKTFTLEVEQRRESAFEVSDYHGLWSHVEPVPAVGVRYLVIARAELTSPAELMQEGPCQRLLDVGSASDVELALGAEKRYDKVLAEKGKEYPELDAARALLKFAADERVQAKDLFADYFWARVEPVFLQKAEDLLPHVLGLIMAADATIGLRRSLLYNLYQAVLLLEPAPDLVATMIKALFSLLIQEEASQLHSLLIEVQLYNLIFRQEQPQFDVAMILPNQADRDQILTVLSGFDSDRSQALMAWLGGG